MKVLEKISPAWVERFDTDGSKAKFKIRPLNPIEKESLMSFVDGGRLVINPDKFQEALEMGLIDWSGVQDAEGHELPFSVESIVLLPEIIRFDLASMILNRSAFSEAEKKT